MRGNALLKEQTVDRNGEAVEHGPGQAGGAPQKAPENGFATDALPGAAIDQFRTEAPLAGRRIAPRQHRVHGGLNGHAFIHEFQSQDSALPGIRSRPGATLPALAGRRVRDLHGRSPAPHAASSRRRKRARASSTAVRGTSVSRQGPCGRSLRTPKTGRG